MSATMVSEHDTKPDQETDDMPANDIEAAMSRALAPVVARATSTGAVIGGGAAASAKTDASPGASEAAGPAPAAGTPSSDAAGSSDDLPDAAPDRAAEDAEPAATVIAMPGPSAPTDGATEREAEAPSDAATKPEQGTLGKSEQDAAGEKREPSATDEGEAEPVTPARPVAGASPTISRASPDSTARPEPMPERQDQPADGVAEERQDGQAAAADEPDPAFTDEPSPEVSVADPDGPDGDEPDANEPDGGDTPTSRANQLASAIVASAAARRRPETTTPDRAADPEPARAALPMTQIRNRVFDHLVEGEDDVIGMITYSLYKQDKRDWLLNWMSQHGSEPTADQVEAFVNAQLSVAQRERYRNAARQVLDAYASVAVDLEKPVIVREALAGRVEEAAKKAEGASRWWRQLGLALLGGALAAGIIIGLVVVLVAFGVDVAGYLGFESGIDL